MSGLRYLIWGPSDCHTSTGLPVWYDNPERTPILAEDMKCAFNVCRYGGQYVYNVLAHSVLVAKIVERMNDKRVPALCAIHDLHEPYIGDRNPRDKTPEFRERELKWEARVHDYFGLAMPNETEARWVKLADRMALLAEMEVVGHPAARWGDAEWDAYGGKPMETPHAVGLAQLYRYTPKEELWRILMDVVRAGGGLVPEV